ncbi:MAG: hypothetical protein IKC71_05370 [Clostridia bacterium]|nr:hypothetical protein [Clostridia bacterium]
MKRLVILFSVLLALSTTLFSLTITGAGVSATEQQRTAETDFSTFSTDYEIGTSKRDLKISSTDLLGGFATVASNVSSATGNGAVIVKEDTDGSKYLEARNYTKSGSSSGFINITFILGAGLEAGREYDLSVTYRASSGFEPAGSTEEKSIFLRNKDGEVGFSDIPLYGVYKTGEKTNGWYTYNTKVTPKADGIAKVMFIFYTTPNTDCSSGVDLKSIKLSGVEDVPEENTTLTTVRINYYNPEDTKQPEIALYKGVHTDTDNTYRETLYSLALNVTGDFVTGVEENKPYIQSELRQGVYYAKVYYRNYKISGDDCIYKYFYVPGDGEPITIDIELKTIEENNFADKSAIYQTDELLELVGTDDLVGFEPLDTPTFTKHTDNSKQFLTNADVCEYITNLENKTDYLKIYYPYGLTPRGLKWPVMVFTNLSFEEDMDTMGANIQALKKEVLMVSGGVHGNEPAGEEGVLAFCNELCTEYGENLLDFFGAIVVMPTVQPDNRQAFLRLDPVTNVNHNRDIMEATLYSSRYQLATYYTFMPTVYIDCHEDEGRMLLDEKGLYTDNLDDVCIRYSTVSNSPLVTPDAEGFVAKKETRMHQMMLGTISNLRTTGLRPTIYFMGTSNPNNIKDYPMATGAYNFLIEVMRIYTGKARYERAVWAMKTALKEIVAQVVSYDGKIAEEVYANRERTAAITKFDENRMFILDTTASGVLKEVMPRPTMYAWGEYKDANATKTYYFNDKISKSRAMPTAYVVDANHPNIDKILDILDVHRIKYTKIKDGSSLLLKKYTGGYENTALTSAQETTFENGAYAVTLNCANAYVIGYLFEPDSHDYTPPVEEGKVSETRVSFAHMGLVTNENTIYRSEVDDIYLTIEGLSVDNPTDDKGGCGSVITVGSTLLSIVLLAGSIVVLKKKD